MSLHQPTNRDEWLDQIVTITEGAALRRISIDTLRKEWRKGRIKVLRLSTRRLGITRREALTGMRTEPGKSASYNRLNLKEALAEIERLKSS
jgi:hypothetical protein